MRVWKPYTIRVQGGHLIRSLHLRALLRRLSLQPRHILDAGCGSGRDALYFAAKYPRARITGIDLDLDEINRAERRRRRYRLRNACFQHADLLEYASASPYDLIYSIEVLEHLPNFEIALQHLANLLNPGGILIIHTPALHQERHWKRFESRIQEDHICEGFEMDKLVSGCRDAGFTICSAEYTFGPYGSLAWELFELIRPYGGFAKRIAMPMIYLLGLLDVYSANRRGNNLLLCAMKL